MSSTSVDDLTTPWESDPSGLWSVRSGADASYLGGGDVGLAISARGGAAAPPAPYVQRTFAAPLDLGTADELRFWFRSSRPGDGAAAQPFYLAFEATTVPPAPPLAWSRLLPVSGRDAWQLQRLWLGDMPAGLRQAAARFRLRGLDAGVAFDAALDLLLAVTPDPIAGTDAALLARLDGRFQVAGTQGPVSVPAVVDLPEAPGERTPPTS